MNYVSKILLLFFHRILLYLPNGLRYPLVGGTRQRRFDGTNFKPRKVPENAQTPIIMTPAYFAGDRVHALLACPRHTEAFTF